MYFNGTKCSFLVLGCVLSLSLSAKDSSPVNGQGLRKPLSFVENKGQIADQYNKPRTDIGYELTTPGMTLYTGSASLHYQFRKTTGDLAHPSSVSIAAYRMDVTLLGADVNAPAVATDEQAYYENYYTAGNGLHGITAHSYNKVTYKNVYPNIDWVLYIRDNKVEYDFVVNPGGNVADIRVQYSGANALNLNNDGSIKATTPMGSISEHSPVAFETGSGRSVASSFKLNGNVLSFATAPHSGSLTIDPSLSWGTYFGGTGEDEITGVAVNSGNTYVSGFTSSTGVATVGAHQTTIGGGFDAFLAKYNSSGIIQFATYFGGAGVDEALGVAFDATGSNVYIAGYTTSNGLASAGAYHSTNNGADDGFLAKFSSTGTYAWSTYYGGTGLDMINGVTTDPSGNIFITGQTASTSLIASSAAVYQPAINGSNDAFLAKFNSAGAVQWSTYYGGTAQENAYGITCDALGNVIFTGETNSVIDIASGGAAHTALSGTQDVYIAKFSTTGSRLWGTYFGGTGTEQGNSVACNQSTGDIVIVGNTTSTSGLATAKAAQTTYGGGVQDAFIAYFSSTGAQSWASYYGGTSLDYGQSVCFDAYENVLLAGGSFSSTGIATAGNYQSTIAGDYDAYVAKFNSLGQRVWGTYYGGTAYDYANGITCDANNLITIGGYTTSTSGIATVGTSQTTNAGGVYDAFAAQFKADTIVLLNQPFTDTLVCAGGTLLVPYTVYPSGATFQPGNTFTVQLSDATGSFSSPTVIGTASATASGSVTCTVPALSGTGYRIRIVASNPAFTSPDDYYDIDIVSSIPTTTASASTPTCIGQTLQLDDTAYYTIYAYSWSGPASFASAAKNPTISSVTLAAAGTYTVTAIHNGCPANTTTVDVVVNSTIPPTPVATAGVGCAGSTLSLYANPDTSATVTYNWVGPGGYSSTEQNPTIPSSTPSNTGYYFVTDTMDGCPSAQSYIYVTILPITTATVSITASPSDTVCANTLILFTATPVNGGVSPTYQWYTAAGVPVSGAISPTWSSTTLTTGDAVYCTMASSIACPSPTIATSNVLNIEAVDNSPSVRIVASPGANVPAGTSVTFTSTVYNGGSGADYQWYLNGVAVHGATSSTYTIPSVITTYTVSLTVTSSMTCAVPNYGVSNVIVAQTNVGVPTVSATLAGLELYPNPNNGSFTIAGNVAGNSVVTFEVTNLLGQVVYTDKGYAQGNTIAHSMDLQSLPDGCYFVKAIQDGNSRTMRFVVRH
jgi:Secretion system C-terminal sorting domain/Beta-propeller repeat